MAVREDQAESRRYEREYVHCCRHDVYHELYIGLPGAAIAWHRIQSNSVVKHLSDSRPVNSQNFHDVSSYTPHPWRR